MNPNTTATRLIAKYGAVDAFWKAMTKVRFHLINGDQHALAFWREMRNECYARIGRSEVWS